MARKSRKNAAAEPVCEAAPLQIFPTAIYARLSVENSGKSEKVDVITNQIEICKSYIAGCPYTKVFRGICSRSAPARSESPSAIAMRIS